MLSSFLLFLLLYYSRHGTTGKILILDVNDLQISFYLRHDLGSYDEEGAWLTAHQGNRLLFILRAGKM